MNKPIIDLAEFGPWALIVWRWSARRCWTYKRLWGWWPNKSRYWSGKITHYYVGPFELIRDTCGGALDILSDMTGQSKEELAERLSEEPGAAGEGE